jgi:exonuclease SbcD
MKILHTADVHLGELAGPIKNGENARMMDTVKCLDFIESEALVENVDVILISGDLFNKSKLWADEMLKEITIASTWLRRLANIAPTVLMFGTANHDNIKAFENIKRMEIERLTVITEPDLVTINTQSGDIQIAAVPGMDRGFYRTLYPGMDMEDENKAISEALGNVILGISADADPSIPLVLMSHYTVTGCTLENGESIFLNSDIVIPTAALAASNYDLVCLGHIHKAQSIPNCSRPVYYSGPPNAITFSEEGQDKGFYIHEIITEVRRNFPYDQAFEPVESKFIKTPSREFKTLNMDEFEVSQFIKYGLDFFYEEDEDGATYYAPVKDKIVRVIYSCTDETNKQFNKKSLEKALYDDGAFYVSEIRPSKILTTADKNAMSENDSVEDNLRLWLEKQEIHAEDSAKVIEAAKPMIAQISASLPTGKLTGVFEPLSLQVKNYRSYLEEEFDFTKVSFATVNGPNGIGKSSFFMDAIADCLYEEPREGELTGWISNSPEIKSGAITFEFLMGTDKWRVVRTRVKSGKATLALQKWNKDKWEDASGDKKDQTQEKILNLLGMDALTFKSCALIMQDNYGVFLEADKTDRMQVLSNILGLSIYDKLHDLAKDELRIQNRKVEALKAEIAELDNKLNDKNIHEEALSHALEEKTLVMCSLKQHEEELKNIRKQIDQLKEIKSKITVLTEKVMAITDDIKTKNIEVEKLKTDKDRAQNIVNQEDKILAKIAEYEQTKDKISVLKTKLPIIAQKSSEYIDICAEIDKTSNNSMQKYQDILKIEDSLSTKRILENQITSLDDMENQLLELDKEETQARELTQQYIEVKQKLVMAKKDYETKLSKIDTELATCKKKAALIENSNCPVDSPTCNFLKDALEAKNKIPGLEEAKLSCDKTQVFALNDQVLDFEYKIQGLEYNSLLHQNTKKQVLELRKKKEQLLSLNGQEQLMQNLLDQRAELEKKLENLKEKQKQLGQELKALKEDTRELSRLEPILEVLEKWYKGKDELPAAKQLLITVNERLQVLENEIANKNIEIKSLEVERYQLAEDRLAITVTEEDERVLEYKIKTSNNELTNIEVAIGIAQSKIDELQVLFKTRVDKAEGIKEFANTANILTLLVKAFSIDGIPFQIVRSVVSELSSQSNEILSQMTGGKMAIEMKTEKVLKNKNEINALEIWISDYQRGTMPYLSRSGGQKVKAALSVAFALADLKANRAGIQLGMMFIDEPPFLDTEGVQAYCDALELMHNRYPSMRVVAISHDPAMKARFPEEIEVIDAGDQGSKILFN